MEAKPQHTGKEGCFGNVYLTPRLGCGHGSVIKSLPTVPQWALEKQLSSIQGIQGAPNPILSTDKTQNEPNLNKTKNVT